VKLLFVADGRSPIALNWIEYFFTAGHEVHLVSTFACSPDLKLASLHIVQVAMSGLRSRSADTASGSSPGSRIGKLAPVRLRTAMRRWLGPLTIPRAAVKLRRVIAQVQPDLVHAMRVPFEGMLAAQALLSLPHLPLVVSVWGNDFTLHAPSTPMMAEYTRLCLQRADALHADCRRDVRLARQWGFNPEIRAFVLPGGGGIQLDLFHLPDEDDIAARKQTKFQVINPRGIRSYIRNDTFFQAIPIILQRYPNVRFICPAMSGEPQALRWVAALNLSPQVELLPRQSRQQMAQLFRRSDLVVSPSEHDGTPNTLLEGMACGCFPVAGNIESVREWIIPGMNGLLFDPGSPLELADQILRAYHEPGLRRSAAAYNTQLIAERAEYQRVMGQAEGEYREILLPDTGSG
jgi:glycosyltransferase involved in cell wall biosynthesis